MVERYEYEEGLKEQAAEAARKATEGAVSLAQEEVEALRYMYEMTNSEKIQYLNDYLEAYQETSAGVLEAEEILNEEMLRLERSRVDQMKVYYAELRDDIQDKANWMAKSFATTFRSIERSLGGSLSDMLTDSKNWKDHLDDFFKSIAKSFANMIADMIAKWMMFKVITGMMGGGGGLVGMPLVMGSGGARVESSSMPSLDSGGTVTATGLAKVHKGETYSGVGGSQPWTINVYDYSGNGVTVETKEDQDEHIIDVIVGALPVHGPLRNGIISL